MLSFRQLRALAALAETEHFRKAAERVHISQPALSAQIQSLEEQLGITLVERTRRRVLFTPAGRAMAERARSILSAVQDMESAARSLASPLEGLLRIGVPPTLGPYLLPHVLPGLKARYQGLRLYLREENIKSQLAELNRGEIDLLLGLGPLEGEGRLFEPLFEEPLWLALPLGHPLAAKARIEVSDLAGLDLVLFERDGDGLRELGLALCRQGGAAEHPDFKATSLDTLRQMVVSGLGASILPALYVTAEALDDSQVVMRPFADPVPARRIDLAWRRTDPRADAFRQLAMQLRQTLPSSVRIKLP
ncbi:MAG: LysR family transcriptional regulator [Alphaproteobacteria bacterium]|nr:LysR family transcriptional regulator [Alphaproteobacteria bacterium]